MVGGYFCSRRYTEVFMKYMRWLLSMMVVVSMVVSGFAMFYVIDIYVFMSPSLVGESVTLHHEGAFEDNYVKMPVDYIKYGYWSIMTLGCFHWFMVCSYVYADVRGLPRHFNPWILYLHFILIVQAVFMWYTMYTKRMSLMKQLAIQLLGIIFTVIMLELSILRKTVLKYELIRSREEFVAKIHSIAPRTVICSNTEVGQNLLPPKPVATNPTSALRPSPEVNFNDLKEVDLKDNIV